ncbi:hypothetical protein IscW_ISCW003745 [Ixodes scapularis]|uniref:Uncharacterized protein n=1 Tax=Ixodes scapularis TaxID=6945 RepID=B7PJM0_IXOSC|nr:hypothetical protein IscW_ISCW003745 [Ixodes scapularis]|eukprot:XP_002408314.1 hypothetical protein IscW_ISCW003745 [Ixodes scapularis]
MGVRVTRRAQSTTFTKEQLATGIPQLRCRLGARAVGGPSRGGRIPQGSRVSWRGTNASRLLRVLARGAN